MAVFYYLNRAKTAKSMRFMDSGPEVGGFGKSNDSDDDTMPIIPDLDDVRDEDMQLQVFFKLFDSIHARV